MNWSSVENCNSRHRMEFPKHGGSQDSYQIETHFYDGIRCTNQCLSSYGVHSNCISKVLESRAFVSTSLLPSSFSARMQASRLPKPAKLGKWSSWGLVLNEREPQRRTSHLKLFSAIPQAPRRRLQPLLDPITAIRRTAYLPVAVEMRGDSRVACSTGRSRRTLRCSTHWGAR